LSVSANRTERKNILKKMKMIYTLNEYGKRKGAYSETEKAQNFYKYKYRKFY
jgi:hypothetical protein